MKTLRRLWSSFWLSSLSHVTIALFLVINAGQNAEPVRVAFGAVSFILSWLMINVMWGMHYAWEFYEAPDPGKEGDQQGGLDFPRRRASGRHGLHLLLARRRDDRADL
jgi:uncharacterized membrane protein